MAARGVTGFKGRHCPIGQLRSVEDGCYRFLTARPIVGLPRTGADVDHDGDPDVESLTGGEFGRRVRRSAIGVIGVAAVPFMLLGVAAAGIGFLVWLVYFLFLLFYGVSSNPGTLLVFLLWSGASLALARWLAKRLPGDGNGGAAAMRFVLIWMAVLWLGFYIGTVIPGLRNL
jgi:hypothetical protein